jgi:ribonuclease G
MAKEICISSTPHETRLAILEDDQLAEIYYERENEYTLAGSIYNGRVTRVLPGMQSAFVDVGLERDAFLYVTDFLELEDPEETDELEKAAASGGSQPPHEVRHAGTESQGGHGEARNSRSGQKSEQKQEPRLAQDHPASEKPVPEKHARNRRIVVEAAPEAGAAVALESDLDSEQAGVQQKDSDEPGAKRWRGRRRRRGGRGGTGSSEGQPGGENTSGIYIEESADSGPEIAPEIHAAASDRSSSQGRSSAASASVRRSDAAPAPRPAPFVLPGESLSKYGGAPEESGAAEEAARPAVEPSAPIRPSSSFKPATLIESPLEWDGSGLLPGESLSRHRNRPDEPIVQETAKPAQELLVQATAEGDLAEEELIVEDEFEETTETVIEPLQAEEVEVEAAEAAEPEADATASHNVDPLPPTGFRIFGLGGKKKAEEEAAKAVKPASATAVSAYAPGSGLIEEEVIEEEEFEAPRHPHHHGRGGDHELDDLEEETLPTQLRSGDLGEMLQEAHLDHRIQLNFDDKNGDEEGFDDEGEDEEPTAEGQPVAGTPSQQRRDRSVRGRRGGRGTLAGQGGQTGQTGRGRGPTRRSAQLSDLPIISDLLKPGQEILVQIAKEPIAKKGARITSHIALPGRFLVFMPTVSHIGVSRKIASDEERQRLKRILVHERGEASGGFIVRTAAEGASEEDLRADLRFLLHLWGEIKQRSDDSKSPALIYHDLSLIERILRDQVSSNFSSIWVDSEADYERIVRFLNRFSPTLVRRVKLYTKETPLFEHFGIQDEISKALRSKVWLKSGGSIVINQTEALVAIDINTGKYVGKSARLEDTIVKTNLDAVPEIVRQIRLRDLGGIIVIDFIDMDDRKNRFRVMAALEEALKSDRAPTKVLQFNDFGLVAITRKRVKQSLERTLSVPCPTCQATGMVKSPTTVCNEIYTELRKMKKHFEGADVLLRVNPETVKVLKSNNGSWLTEFEELVGKNILTKSDATLHPEQFDIQG